MDQSVCILTKPYWIQMSNRPIIQLKSKNLTSYNEVILYMLKYTDNVHMLSERTLWFYPWDLQIHKRFYLILVLIITSKNLEWCPPGRMIKRRPRNSRMQEVATGMREKGMDQKGRMEKENKTLGREGCENIDSLRKIIIIIDRKSVV